MLQVLQLNVLYINWIEQYFAQKVTLRLFEKFIIWLFTFLALIMYNSAHFNAVFEFAS